MNFLKKLTYIQKTLKDYDIYIDIEWGPLYFPI